MRRIWHIIHVLIIIIVILSSASAALSYSNSSGLLNRISGQVFDQSRIPVPDVDVELLNSVDSVLTRTRTNTAGAFNFIGVSSGHFQVRVIPLRRGLIGETKDVDVTPLYAGGSDSVYVDFYLQNDKRSAAPVPRGPGEAIFVQDIPDKAKKLYESGIEKLERGQQDGLLDIKSAIEAYPIYWDALGRLGREYVRLGKYTEGYPFLLRAVDVDQRSAANYYSLAFAFYRLNQIPAALKAVQACLALNGASGDANLLFGTLLRQNKSYKEAEAILLKALGLYGGSNSEVHWQLALLYNRTGKNAKAIEQLELYSKKISDIKEKKKIEDLIAKLRASKGAVAQEKN